MRGIKIGVLIPGVYPIIRLKFREFIGDKLQVSFAEYRLFHRALFHKRRTLFRSLLIVATP